MKQILVLAALTISILVSGVDAQRAAQRTEPLMPGATAPDFTLSAADGSKVTLSSIGRPTVLVFYRGYW